MRSWLPLLALLGCGGPPTADSSVGVSIEMLSDSDRLLRISMALRGVRPDHDDYAQIAADPDLLEAIVDDWLDDPLFGETVKDMWAEALLIRADTEPLLLSSGIAEGVPSEEVFGAMSESSLRLIENVVMNDAPFHEIVTADYVMTNALLSEMYGTSYEIGGSEWQETRWLDTRPTAGVLSDNGLWMRFPSNGSNFHRGRAAFVAKTFLCDDFNTRDVDIDGGIDLSNDQAVAEAVTTIPTCVGCHQALEPLAAFFWGYRDDVLRTGQFRAYRYGCQGEYGDYCYPLGFWKPEREDDWISHGLTAPGYFGAPAERFTDLGEYIAGDSRFATCTARRFHAYLTQGLLLEAPLAQINPLRDELVTSGFDAKALAKAVVMHPSFAVARHTEGSDGTWPAMQVIRPEQYARTLFAFTGFRLRVAPGSTFDGVFRDVDLGITDRFGFRAMSGGVDGLQVTQPTHVPTPTKVMVMRFLATESAGFVVENALAGGPWGAALFTEVDNLVEPTKTEVRAQIIDLHARILGEFLDFDDPEITRTVALYDEAISRGLNPPDAWKQVLSALFQDPRMMFY